MDVEEFQTFYQEHFRLIYRYVYSQVGNREEAEDLTSDIFLKVVRAINYEYSPRSIQGWLYRVARATVADHWRAYYRVPTSSLDELSEVGWECQAEEASIAISRVPAHLVQQLLQALPEQYREVLVCRFLLNLSIRATAVRMGLTVANVKVLQFRAIKRAATLEHVITERQNVL